LLFGAPEKLSTKEVLDWHGTLSSGLTDEHLRAKNLGPSDPFPPSLLDALFGATSAEIDTHFEGCETELNISAGLFMIAAAEARIRTDALKRSFDADPLGTRLGMIFRRHVQKWKVGLYDPGIMAEWKRYVNLPGLFSDSEKTRLLRSIGRFGEALDFRHWVSHGRYWQFNRDFSDFQQPANVAARMDELFKALPFITTSKGLRAFP
jgi:hypothetical protein